MPKTPPGFRDALRAPHKTVGELPTRGAMVSPELPVLDLEQLFMDDPLLTSVVVASHEPRCITRDWFLHQMIGPLGFGRGLYLRRPVEALPEKDTLVLAAGTPILSAARAVLERPEVQRYDDVVVRFPNGALSTFRVAELFAELAHIQAYDGLHDALTGLPNRRLFFDLLSKVHGQSTEGPGTCFAILFIDIDDFKTINDALGHAGGDQALVETARRLLQLQEPDVTISRLGGDEFAILIQGDGADGRAEQLSERISELMSAPMPLEGEQVFLTASVGLATVPNGGTPDAMMRDADVAMYETKHRQKGLPSQARTMHTQARERLGLRAQLKGALQRDEFRLVFQPIVALEGASVTGVEALLRWNCPAKGLVMPDRFIPMCEQTGMIVPLGRWVLEEACRQAVAWADAHPDREGLRMSVNVSQRQLQEPPSPPRLNAPCRAPGCDLDCSPSRSPRACSSRTGGRRPVRLTGSHDAA